MVFLVHSAIHLYGKLADSRKTCTKYFQTLLKTIDSTFSHNKNLYRCLSNIIFKADVLNSSDRENELGCLRRTEKFLSKNKFAFYVRNVEITFLCIVLYNCLQLCLES